MLSPKTGGFVTVEWKEKEGKKNPVPSSLSGVNPQQKTVESRPLVEAVAEIKT